MATLIKVDGTKEEIDIGGAGSLNFMQTCVGGFIEVVPLPASSGYEGMICDEEGKLRGKAINEEASRIYREHNKASSVHNFGCLVGDVILFKAGEME